MEIVIGIVIGIAFSAFMPSVPLKIRSIFGWDKKDKDKDKK